MPTDATDTTPATLSKSDFVRSQPADMSVKDVLARAQEAGIVMTGSLVRKVRARLGGVPKLTATPSAMTAAEKATSTAPATKTRAKPAKEAPVATNSTAESPAPTMTKTAFILARPTMSAAQVVVAGEEAGVSLSANQVYAVRSKHAKTAKPTTAAPAAVTAKRAAPAVAAKPVAPKPAVPPMAVARPVASPKPDAEDRSASEFARLVIAIGMGRAEALLLEVRAKLASLLDR